MHADCDFLWMDIKVFTERSKVKVIFPDRVNIEDYEISAFILDIRLTNVRDLCCTINRQENSAVIEDEKGLGFMRRLNEGDTILFRYRR